jgi:hypothetical protein
MPDRESSFTTKDRCYHQSRVVAPQDGWCNGGWVEMRTWASVGIGAYIIHRVPFVKFYCTWLKTIEGSIPSLQLQATAPQRLEIAFFLRERIAPFTFGLVSEV